MRATSLAVPTQVLGALLAAAGVYMLFGLGVALVAAGVVLVAVGVLAELYPPRRPSADGGERYTS